MQEIILAKVQLVAKKSKDLLERRQTGILLEIFNRIE
jgi:hypothetical protein